MLHKRIGIFLCLVGLSSLIAGCQPGRFTDDRRYVGNPERPEATSEPTSSVENVPARPTPEDRK
ncbi:hypothetical protein YTPLAS72_00370 [Nitrospira sp.]|nr:hypothetical protein YTPLAS72_00370 [Nitrospira sp.]